MKLPALVLTLLAATSSLLPGQAGATEFGTSCSGTSLSSVGLPLVPSTNFGLDFTGGPAGGQAVLFLGITGEPVIPFFGCEFYPGIGAVDLLLPTLDASGNVMLPIPISSDPGAIGLEFVLQVLTVDPSQTASLGIGFSTGLLVRLGAL